MSNYLKAMIYIIIACLSLTLFPACNGIETKQNTTAQDMESGDNDLQGAQDSEKGDDYLFQDLDCNNGDFTIFNTSTEWGFLLRW